MLVVNYKIFNNDTKSKQAQQNNHNTDNAFQLTSNIRLNKKEDQNNIEIIDVQSLQPKKP